MIIIITIIIIIIIIIIITITIIIITIIIIIITITIMIIIIKVATLEKKNCKKTNLQLLSQNRKLQIMGFNSTWSYLIYWINTGYTSVAYKDY